MMMLYSLDSFSNTSKREKWSKGTKMKLTFVVAWSLLISIPQPFVSSFNRRVSWGSPLMVGVKLLFYCPFCVINVCLKCHPVNLLNFIHRWTFVKGNFWFRQHRNKIILLGWTLECIWQWYNVISLLHRSFNSVGFWLLLPWIVPRAKMLYSSAFSGFFTKIIL